MCLQVLTLLSDQEFGGHKTSSQILLNPFRTETKMLRFKKIKIKMCAHIYHLAKRFIKLVDNFFLNLNIIM